jgi:hypothetical protein
MNRILIRAGKRPGQAVLPEADHAYRKRGVTGMNAGNHLYFDSVFRLISTPGTEVVPDALLSASKGADQAYAQAINEGFDAYVLVLTNSFRPDFVDGLNRYAALVERLTIPVVVVGAGTQLAFDQGLDLGPKVAKATTRLLRAVLDRSARFGVRGDTTREYLATLGFGDQHVQVVGCPSLYLRGPDYAIRPRPQLTADSKLAVNIAIRDEQFAPFVTRAISDHPNLMYVAQTNEDLATFLWGVDRLQDKRPWYPTYLAHPLMVQDRARMFLDPRTWIDFLADYEYMVGTRIHGNVAALLGTTPSTLVAIDKRTWELGEYHDIPMIKVEDLRPDDTFASVLDRSDWSAFNAGLRPRYETLLGFFAQNGIETIGVPGKENPQFDADLAAAQLPGPISPLVTGAGVNPEALVSRLAWLRQGLDTDSKRKVGAYNAEFPIKYNQPMRKRLSRIKHALLG